MMTLFQKSVVKILLGSAAFLLFIAIAISFYFLFLNCTTETTQYTVCTNEPVTMDCGMHNLSGDATEGKHLFNRYCAMCHKLNATMTGPALRNTDSVVFRKWLYYQDVKIDTTKLDRFNVDFHRDLSKNNLKTTDLENLHAYIGS